MLELDVFGVVVKFKLEQLLVPVEDTDCLLLAWFDHLAYRLLLLQLEHYRVGPGLCWLFVFWKRRDSSDGNILQIVDYLMCIFAILQYDLNLLLLLNHSQLEIQILHLQKVNTKLLHIDILPMILSKQ